jgi:hypothetical protein
MDTTAAATQAGVTAATIRTWCRRNAIAATKTAGRWIIDAASLAHRIALAAHRTRKAPAMDLSATYTHTYAYQDTPTVITPTITTRTRSGMQITTITGIAALLADRINTITDEGDRLHAFEALRTARIHLRSIADEDAATGRDNSSSWRESGRIATDYRGTTDLPVSAVLDLAEQIRAAL